MQKILVGYDGSEGAKQALNKAKALINENGEIVLLAVVPSPKDESFLDKNIYKDLEKKANTILDEAIQNLGSPHFKVNGLVENGDAAEKIIDISHEMKCDLIVLGSSGTSKISRYLLGSVANKVVQYAHVPVMVVR